MLLETRRRAIHGMYCEKNLAELSCVGWKADFEYLAEEISKQSVEDTALSLFVPYSKS